MRRFLFPLVAALVVVGTASAATTFIYDPPPENGTVAYDAAPVQVPYTVDPPRVCNDPPAATGTIAGAQVTVDPAPICVDPSPINGTVTYDAPSVNVPYTHDPPPREVTVPENQTPPPSQTTCDATASPGQNTANALLNSLSSGQVGCLHGGTYTASSSNVLDITHANVTLMSYPGETAVLRGLAIIRSGANGLKLDHLSFNGTGIASNTIQVYADDVVISNSDITNAQNGRSCLYLGDMSVGIADRPQILNNKFHECGILANGNQDHAIYAAHVRGGQISGNWFWNTAAYAIQFYPDAQGMLFSHNTIDGGSPSVRGGVIFAGESTPSSNNVVEQNVIAYSKTYNVESYWGGPVGTGNVARNNCVWAGGSGNFSGSGYTQSGNVVADPMFVDRAGRNYNLNPESGCVAVVGG